MVQRLAGHPRHDRPQFVEPCAGRAAAHRDGQGQAGREQRQPPAFLELVVGVGVHALDPHSQLVPQAPQLVAPAALDLAQGQLGQVRVLVP
ncbi:hypothetical protein GCM10026982_10320 [Nocardiopsis aegyptia]